MTKERAPLSLDSALARIAGQLPGSWAEMAVIAGRSESTVRRWGDEAQPEQLTMPAAIAFDIAYERAGGVGRPIFETYALQLDLSREDAFSGEIALAHQLGTVMRESGEAHQAMLLATLPSATAADRRNAIRELKEAMQEKATAITMLSPCPPDTS